MLKVQLLVNIQEETLPERINEISQCLLAAHSGKGIKDNEVHWYLNVDNASLFVIVYFRFMLFQVRKLIKDAPRLAEKNIKEVLGCKVGF